MKKEKKFTNGEAVFYTKTSSIIGAVIVFIILIALGTRMLFVPFLNPEETMWYLGATSLGVLIIQLMNYFNKSKVNAEILKYRSRKGELVLAILILALFVLIGVSLRNTPYFGRALGSFIILFSAAYIINAVFEMATKKTKLKVDGEGVYLNLSLFIKKKISWNEIENILIYDYLGSKLIALILTDDGAQKHRNLRIYELFTGSSKLVSISATLLPIPVDELFELLYTRWKKEVAKKN